MLQRHQETTSPQQMVAPEGRDKTLLLHYAFEYWDRGFSLLPLDGKLPIFPWKEYQSRRPTREELRAWFADGTHNIGIVTGSVSGLVVVDCDTPEDAEFWLKTYPKSALIAQTGRRGSHIYYQYPDADVRNHTRILGRQIDIRGEGGFVVAPPSRHPETKALYAWSSAGDFSLCEVPIFDPQWLGPTRTPPGTCTSRRIRNPVSYLRSIRAVAGQRGHDQTFRAACILRDAGLTPEEALAELVIWNASGNAEPPWTVHELLHKVRSAYQQGARG